MKKIIVLGCGRVGKAMCLDLALKQTITVVDISKENLDGSRSFSSYNLSRVLDGSLEITLEDQDQIRIFTLDEVEGDYDILLFGFGVEDSVIIPWRENLRLYDLVFSNSPFEEKEFQENEWHHAK